MQQLGAVGRVSSRKVIMNFNIDQQCLTKTDSLVNVTVLSRKEIISKGRIYMQKTGLLCSMLGGIT